MSVVVFDVNGTLLNTHAVAPKIRKLFGSNYSVTEWFHEVIAYSMASTLTGNYREFGDIAASVLRMNADAQGVRVSSEDVEAIRTTMRTLPAFPDVSKGLRRLKEGGLRLAALSNSGRTALQSQMEHTRLTPYFESVLSVSIVQRYKPAKEVYETAAEMLNVTAGDILMVAAHPWDLMGAARAGCRTAFIRRPGKSLLPGMQKPDYIADDLNDLADQLAPETHRTGSVPATGVLTAAVAGGLLLWASRSRTRRWREVTSAE